MQIANGPDAMVCMGWPSDAYIPPVQRKLSGASIVETSVFRQRYHPCLIIMAYRPLRARDGTGRVEQFGKEQVAMSEARNRPIWLIARPVSYHKNARPSNFMELISVS
jgi:hypothetical protein